MSSLLFVACLCASCQPDDAKPVSLTVVVVLATESSTAVDPKLRELAKEVQKRDPKLTGFKLVATESKSVPVGDTATVNLTDKQVLKLTVDRAKDKDGRISLTLNPPGMDAVTYACACDKFFPVVTPHKTKAGEQLLVAIMAKPCVKK